MTIQALEHKIITHLQIHLILLLIQKILALMQ